MTAGASRDLRDSRAIRITDPSQAPLRAAGVDKSYVELAGPRSNVSVMHDVFRACEGIPIQLSSPVSPQSRW
jgi:hypothetical protein